MTTISTLPSTKETQRLFLAVSLPDSIKKSLGIWMSQIRTSHAFRKWVDEADLHVTLQFLGDMAPYRIPELKTALEAVVGSDKVHPFTLSIENTGTFGRLEQPTVLWAGIEGELKHLYSLQRLIVETTAPLGFPAEKRPYKPHLTLARSYIGKEAFSQPKLILGDGLSSKRINRPDQQGSHDGMEQQADENENNLLVWRVDDIVLYRTQLGQSPMYEVAARFALSQFYRENNKNKGQAVQGAPAPCTTHPSRCDVFT